jgi:hypothetical protein
MSSQSPDSDNGITDLLKQVAMRNDSSLSQDQRKEVDNMVKRVELYKGRHTVAGKLKIKQHDAEEFMKNTKKKLNNEESNQEYLGIEHQSLSRRMKNNKEPTRMTDSMNKMGESVNKIGEDMNKIGQNLVQKMSILTPQKDPSASSASAPAAPPAVAKIDPKEVLQKLNVMNLQSPVLNKEEFNKKTAEQMQKMKEAYERSQQENAKKMEKMKEALDQSKEKGRKSMQNFSMNFKKNLRNLETFLTSPQPEPPKPVDKNSAEYKMDVKGIQLLREIFPNESPESLIKLHFEHIDSQKGGNKTTK